VRTSFQKQQSSVGLVRLPIGKCNWASVLRSFFKKFHVICEVEMQIDGSFYTKRKTIFAFIK
jgi:hypothetical protein